MTLWRLQYFCCTLHTILLYTVVQWFMRAVAFCSLSLLHNYLYLLLQSIFAHEKNTILCIRVILINDSSDSNHLSKFSSVAFTKKEERNTQPSTEHCRVHTRIIFILCFVYTMLSYGESKSTTSCVLLSMSTLSTSNFEYD